MLGHYVATDRCVCSVATTRLSGASARSLRRYVATELCSSSVATQRPSSVHAWSRRSDRAWLVRGPIAILELVRGWVGYLSVALDSRYLIQSRHEQDFTARFLVEILFTMSVFGKNVHADFLWRFGH